MLRQTWKFTLCLLVIGPSVYAQQTGTTRVFKIGGAALQESAERLTSPYVDSGNVNPNVDTSQAVARPSSALPSAGLLQQDSSATDSRTFAERQRDNAIAVAEKRVEFARQQVADLARYNVWAPPQDQPPMAVRMLPHSVSYSPVDVADPVQSFEPRSTFAHVSVASDRELTAAELQLATLIAERDVAKTRGQNENVAAAPTSSDDGTQLAYIEASLQRERFLAESAELRLAQLSKLSELTYSGLYPTLYRKLELERLGHELAVQSLEHERDSLENGANVR
jgi:hypothetical protein